MAKLTLCSLVIIAVFSINLSNQEQATLKSLAKAHNRYFGFAVDPTTLTAESDYALVADREFDCFTPENHMKWKLVENQKGVFTFEKGDLVVAHAQKHGQIVRGHCLVWHEEVPTWVTNAHYNATQLLAVLKTHITQEAGHYKGKLYAWDVLNEAINEDGTFRSTIWYDTIGKSFIGEAFRFAHETDPAAKLYYNDYNVEGFNAKSNAMYALIKELKSQKVPIHGVGFQSHFILGELPADIQKNFERFTALDVDVAITELDIRMKMPATAEKLEQQAKDYATVVKACLAVPRCVGITTWGFTDKHSWVPYFMNDSGSALIYDEHYKEKPAYTAIKHVLEGK